MERLYYKELFKSIEFLKKELNGKSPQDPRAFAEYQRLLNLYAQIDTKELLEILEKQCNCKSLG